MLCLWCNEKEAKIKFCSLPCSYQYKGQQKHIKSLKERICKQCNSVFSYNSKNKTKLFCNHSCAASYNNLGVKRSTRWRLCRNCNKLIKRNNRSLCLTCKEDQKTRLWLAGRISGNGSYIPRSFVRKYIVQRDKNKCILCNLSAINPYSKKSILHLDHIDGNWMNCNESNLRLLCPNCHAMTPNFGALNMGNGRSWKANYKQYFAHKSA